MNLYYWLGYNLSRLIAKILFRFRIVHRDRMIQTGPVILAMNHESYLDPPLAGNACDRAIYFLMRRSLLDVWGLGWLLPKLNVIPVEQEGMDRSALKTVIRVLKAGEGVLIFPEGARTLDGNLQAPLPGLGLIIARTLAPVVPMRIFGAHEALPRGGGRLRADLLYRGGHRRPRQGCLHAPDSASHGCDRCLKLGMTVCAPKGQIE